MKKTCLVGVLSFHALIALVFWSQPSSSFAALPFTVGNLTVLQAAASANNTTCAILELSPTTAGQGSPVNTVAINGTVNPGALRISGSGSTTGYLSMSDDGSLLVFTGAQTNDTAANANTYVIRGVGTLNSAGTFVLQTAYTGINGAQTRGACSINKSAWLVGDQGGIYANGSTSPLISGNFRSLRSFAGTEYVFNASTFAAPVLVLSGGGTMATALPGLPAPVSTDQDFYMVSSGANGATYDVLYILSATTATAGTISKYSLVSGSWTANGTYATSFGGFGLAAAKGGTGAFLYVTTGLGANTGNSVIRLTDTAGYNAAIAITMGNNVTLYTTTSTTILKGIAFAPGAAGSSKATPSFSNLTASQSILTGTASIALAGKVSASGPLYPAMTEKVSATINGTSVTNTFSDSTGDFTLTFPTATLAAGTYPITYAYPGNATLNAAADASTGLTVTNLPAPVTNGMQLVRTVFVIALENHNLTQAATFTSQQQLLGNTAAPYFNSLITPGNTNAAQVSYATHYYNVGVGTHGSEPNYIWSEAGSDFDVHTSADPSVANGNLFTVPHLTGEMTAAGIPWHDYQEDEQYSSSPIFSASGSGVAVNPYNGTTEYFYAVKHNSMAFFTDTDLQNVSAMTNLLNDLTNNLVGRYNWITPDEYNEMHSQLPEGFTYHGIAYSGDQQGVAEGDNCLSILIPEIMASQAYRSNGMIVIWTDETEGGDTTNFTLPAIVISPLAKGNAYASPLEYSHSSDLRSMLEIFGLNFFSNTIPAAETRAAGTGYNNISTVNDFSDMFINYLAPTSFSIKSAPGAGYNLSFVLGTNQPYRVLTTDHVDAAISNWTQMTSGIVTANPVVVGVTNGPGTRFFRVVTP